MSKQEITAAADAVFDEILADLILSTAIAAHRDIKRGRVDCGVCGTKCRSHNPLVPTTTTAGSSSSALQIPFQGSAGPSSSSSRAPSPAPSSQLAASGSGTEGRTGGYAIGPEKGTGGSTGIGSGSGKMDGSGNVFFDCLVCGRGIASMRYAPHLSACLGFNGSTRRAASRMAATKAKLGGPGERSSPSPYVHSENGDSDGDSLGSKKAKKPMMNGNGKRGKSPNRPVPQKKTKLSGAGGTPTHNRTLQPSRLGRPPTSASAYSPERSPSRSVTSIPGSEDTFKGSTGMKTLPGLGGAGAAAPIMVVDDDEIDDY